MRGPGDGTVSSPAPMSCLEIIGAMKAEETAGSSGTSSRGRVVAGNAVIVNPAERQVSPRAPSGLCGGVCGVLNLSLWQSEVVGQSNSDR